MNRDMFKFSNTERIIVSIMIIIAALLIGYSLSVKPDDEEIILPLVTLIIVFFLVAPIIDEFLDNSRFFNDKISPYVLQHQFGIISILSFIFTIIPAITIYQLIDSDNKHLYILSYISDALNHTPQLKTALISIILYSIPAGFSIKFLELYLMDKYLLHPSKINLKYIAQLIVFVPLNFLFKFIVGIIFASTFDLSDIGGIKSISHILILFLLATIYVSGQFFEPLIERIFEQHSNKSKPKNIIFQVLNPTDKKPIEISNDIIVTLESDNGPVLLKISNSEE